LWRCMRSIHITMKVDELGKGMVGLGGEKCKQWGKQGDSEDVCRKKQQGISTDLWIRRRMMPHAHGVVA